MKLIFASILAVVSAKITKLASFDGAEGTTWKWSDQNDPVMGGKSVSSFNIADNLGVFNGTCAIVPSLQAPGFCKTTSAGKLFGYYPDISEFLADGTFQIRARTDTPDFKGFKVAFGAKNVPGTFFHTFKAPFEFSGTDFEVVEVEFGSFSWDWSSYTGACDTKDPTGTQHHCCSAAEPKYCPNADYLSTVTHLEVWAEGAEGDFHLEIDWIGAGDRSPAPAAPVCSDTEYCCPDALHCLTATKTSCKGTGTCDNGLTCCPLTELCVEVGKACTPTPTCAKTEFCCPEAKHCLTPTNPGVVCSGPSDCKDSEVCCPVTNLCVSVGAACEPTTFLEQAKAFNPFASTA